MLSGLRAMMKAAESEPLDFMVSMYTGDVLVTGRVAPRDWWAPVSKAARHQQIKEQAGAQFREKSRQEILDRFPPFETQMNRVSAFEDSIGPTDEVTLVDVTVFPAVGSVGTRSGGHSLPVARVPLASITIWWVVDGQDIKGSGSGISWGFAFPV